MCHKSQDFTVNDPLMASAGSSAGKAYTKDEARGFKEIFPDIVRELTFDGPYKDVPTVNSHVAKVIVYQHAKQSKHIIINSTYFILN